MSNGKSSAENTRDEAITRATENYLRKLGIIWKQYHAGIYGPTTGVSAHKVVK